MPLDRFISDGYSFLVEMLFVAAGQGSRIAEVPITFVERRQGESKLSRAVLLESALTPWRLIARGRSVGRTARRSGDFSCYRFRDFRCQPIPPERPRV